MATQIPISGLSPEQKPSPDEMAEVVEFASEHQVKTFFFETLVDPKVAQVVADEIGARPLYSIWSIRLLDSNTAQVEQEMYLREYPELRDSWSEQYGDRIHKVVFIGIKMDQLSINETLDKCILTDAEMLEDWSRFKDTLPDIH